MCGGTAVGLSASAHQHNSHQQRPHRRQCPWQAIAFLAYLAEARGEHGPWLIVAPASLLPNWEAELAAWAPALVVLAYKGSAQAREALFTSQVVPAWPHRRLATHLHARKMPQACTSLHLT